MRAQQRGQCRIIAGKWRGRIIRFDDAEGLRPTTDRIRETVFNWLQPYLQHSQCLDAFAGSGVLGLEALSRGAASAVFVEKNKLTVANLKQNLLMLKAGNANVQQADVVKWLGEQPTDRRFDLVFLDPPFASELLEVGSILLNSSGCLADDAIIYVEHAADTEPVLPQNWSCFRQKVSGQVAYKLFETLK